MELHELARKKKLIRPHMQHEHTGNDATRKSKKMKDSAEENYFTKTQNIVLPYRFIGNFENRSHVIQIASKPNTLRFLIDDGAASMPD